MARIVRMRIKFMNLAVLSASKWSANTSSFSYENLPFHRACLDGNVDMVKVMLDAGANPNAVAIFDWGDVESALICAVRANQPGVVQVLVDAGAVVDGEHARGRKTLAAGPAAFGAQYDDRTPLEMAKSSAAYDDIRLILLGQKRNER